MCNSARSKRLFLLDVNPVLKLISDLDLSVFLTP